MTTEPQPDGNGPPNDLASLAAAAVVEFEEEPARVDLVRLTIAVAACLAVAAFVVAMVSLWAAWTGGFWIPGSGACDPYSGVCPERPWHDWVSSWFGM